jgi:antibiotic biosynthesis monooxygenase (ABM) superfamily enzyme
MQPSAPPTTLRARFWKHFVLTFGVVYPTQQVLMQGLVPALRPWLEGVPTWSRDIATVALMCLVLMRALPAVYRAGNAWLTR